MKLWAQHSAWTACLINSRPVYSIHKTRVLSNQQITSHTNHPPQAVQKELHCWQNQDDAFCWTTHPDWGSGQDRPLFAILREDLWVGGGGGERRGLWERKRGKEGEREREREEGKHGEREGGRQGGKERREGGRKRQREEEHIRKIEWC